MTGLQSLGDPNAVVCDGDVCYLPGADGNVHDVMESGGAGGATPGRAVDDRAVDDRATPGR